MKHILLSLLACLCLSIALQAQTIPQNPNLTDKDGKRQGKWTILYDKDWNIIQEQETTEFYRTIEYKDDKPIGTVKDHYKNGIAQMEASLLADRPEDIYEGTVSFYDAEGKKEKEAIYKNGIVVSEQSFLDENSWQVLNNNGGKLYNEGKFKEAQAFWEKAIIQAEKEFGKAHANYALSCNNLAGLYQFMSNYAAAESLYLEAKKIREKTLGKEHFEYATSCNNLAVLYEAMGNYIAAEPLYVEAKKIRAKTLGKEHPSYAISCNNLAELYRLLSNYAAAEPLYMEAKKILEKTLGKEHPNYATCCSNLAISYEAMGKFVDAEALFVEVKKNYEKALGKEHPLYAQSCNNLARLYVSMGNYVAAKPLYQETIKIIDKTLGKEHPYYAISCTNLAGFYKAMGNYVAAEPLYQETKKIFEKSLGKEHSDYATSCNNLAELYRLLGNYTASEPLYMEAQKIFEKALGKDSPSYAICCSNLALLYEKQGLYDRAEPLYIEAKEIQAKVLGKEHPNYAQSCNNLAGLYSSQGLYTKALPLCREASQILIQQTESNFANLSEKERGLFLKTFSDDFEIYNSFTLKAYRQSPTLTGWLYDNTLAIKGLLFQSTEKMRRNILSSRDTSLVRLFEDWKAKREYMARVATLTIADKQKKGIDEKKLEAEANDLEKQLSLRASKLQGLSADKTRYTWQDVQKSLKPGEAAIEIIRTRYYDKKWTDSVLYIALIVRPETKEQPQMVILPNGEEMEKEAFNDFGDLVASRGTRNDTLKNKKVESNEDLDFELFTERVQINPYLIYWKPIRDALYKSGKPTKIYIALDGIYHKISLLGLQNPDTKQYLLDEVEIHQVGSTKDIVKWQKQSKTKSSTGKPDAVLVGYPTYDLSQEAYKTYVATPAESRGDDIGGRLENIYWKPLSGTEKEINTIAKTLQAQKIPVQTYMQAKASEELVKRVQFPRILHIATHGAFFEKEEREVDDRNRLGNQANQVVEFSPMLRSGLALAGIGNFYQSKDRPQTDDGFLTAYEAMNLNLDNTELVVLSACETGLGEAKSGEGVFGLQRGFQQAGAKTVLMSLWSVDDAATQELMTLFYTNWLSKKQTKRKAFKNAQETLRKTYPQPYYWGAFVMVGE